MIWNRVPFIRVLLPFAAGLILFEYQPGFVKAAGWITGILFVLYTMMLSGGRYQLAFRSQWIYGVVFNLAMCSAGYLLMSVQSDLGDEEHYANFLTSGEQSALISITEPVALKEKVVQAEVEVLQLFSGTSWNKTRGKGMLYFSKDTFSETLEAGDICIARSQFRKVPEPANPGAFDYAKYLARSDIHYSSYIRTGEWKKLGGQEVFNINRALGNLKKSLKMSMTRAGATPEAHALITALTLGDKDELSAGIKEAYSKAGVLHILAVSGLHVGIIYLVINYLLNFLVKFRRGKIVKSICVILLLWGYVALTGMSPSVTRAGVMFSFVIAGTALNKYSNIYNTLCVSAFFMLLFQPHSLLSAGFQLSYAAVLGIVFLYPRLYKIWNPGNWLVDKIWVLACVSLAAQIATFPLSLYYFHQFPNYFLPANIVVVPVATGIIYLALLLYATLPFPLLAKPIAALIGYLVSLLNRFIAWVEKLPYAVTGGIELHTEEVLMIFLMIGGVIAYFRSAGKAYLFFTLMVLLAFCFDNAFWKWTAQSQRRLIVYNIPGHSAFDLIEGEYSRLTADTALVANEQTLTNAMENNWRQLRVREQRTRLIEPALSQGTLGIQSVISEKRILFPGKIPARSDTGDLNKKVKVDILILSDQCEGYVADLARIYDIGQVVIDSSVPRYKLRAIIRACNDYSLPYYSVVRSGAFVRRF